MLSDDILRGSLAHFHEQDSRDERSEGLPPFKCWSSDTDYQSYGAMDTCTASSHMDGRYIAGLNEMLNRISQHEYLHDPSERHIQFKLEDLILSQRLY